MAEKDPKIMENQSAKYQYLAALVVNLLTISFGMACGWPSPSIFLLLSDETPLPTGRITIEEASWVASSMSIGSLAGNILAGYLTHKYGRKKTIIFIAFPTIVCWLLILYAQNVYYLYAARFLYGLFACGVLLVTPLFLSEIANDRVRGFLGSTVVLSANLGILIALILGNYCDFFVPPKVVITLCLLFVILFSFFPESPLFLLKQNRISEAKKSIRFYQNMRDKNNDYELLEIEINKLKNTFNSSAAEKSDGSSFKWSELTSGPGRKAITIGIVLMIVNQFSGCFPMLSYIASIFKDAGSNLSPNMSAMIVGAVQLLGSYVTTNLVDRTGRKFLYVVSTVGTALGLITLGVYMMLKTWQYDVEPFNFVPIASFSFVIFCANLGILSLPFLIIPEVFPENLKNFGMTFCMILLGFCAFLATKFLPYLIEAIAFHGSMYSFAGVCFFGALFIMMYMPETKGRSYDQIMESLR